MPNNLDSVIANDALQQTSAPPCSPRLYIRLFVCFWALAITYKTPCYKTIYVGFLIVAYNTWTEDYSITFQTIAYKENWHKSAHLIYSGPNKYIKTEPSGPLRSLYVCLKWARALNNHY